jgi:hypothetical protein
MRLLPFALLGGLLCEPAMAFEEATISGGQKSAPAPQAPVLEPPKGQLDTGRRLNLTVPEFSIGGSSGTEVRIPGLGTVGKLPKLDFGLELLYGASEPNKGLPDDKGDSGDLQIRGTVKHRF